MSALLQLFRNALLAALPPGAERLAAPHLPGASAALTGATLAHTAPSQLCLVVVDGMAEMERIHGDLCAIARESGVVSLPLPPAITDDSDCAALRRQAVQALHKHRTPTDNATPHPLVLVATLHALMQPIPLPEALNAASLSLQQGMRFNFDKLVESLTALGYARTMDVDMPATLAVRGGLLDVWAPGAPAPLRAEFFGDTLESLRAFDPTTQRSTTQLATALLPPCMERELPTTTLFDTLPHGLVVLWIDHDQLRASALFPPDRTRQHLAWDEILRCIAERTPSLQLFCGDPPPPATPTLPLAIATLPGMAELGASVAHHPELLMQARHHLLDDLNQRATNGEKVLLFADTAGTCELLANELGAESSVVIQRATLSGGFSLPGLTLAAQPDLYAMRKQTTRRTTAANTIRGGRVERVADLEPGDLVVHLDHGIGRFLGSTEIQVGGERSEVFTLEYAEGTRLHVPVSHAHLLSRYVGVAGHKAKLHRLGGRRWTRDKADAERAVADLAASLLDTQAQRQVVAGRAFNPEPVWLREFEATFPWQETEDQVRVIAEVKADMAATRPMDRLVCGDAGYGKTEVAMRAAFIAVMNNMQVAVLVPTTILAEQHYETFRERMESFPVKVGILSRFHSNSRRAVMLEEVRNGKVDIIIGTHAILSDQIIFQNLGLLIIDEEQRFGVKHKEKLKLARRIVDVLTLSATPIPRTLYMSMTGARDMSLLQTPPRERVAVETKVARDADTVIRNAIMLELNRRGQAYFLYNRVLTIQLMRERLVRLVPEARVAIAHGQMPSGELAQAMRDFESGAVDVLLCTTIVESGLDIPRANTILIHRADRFGIADLYQLRGRVGRSFQKGFAWLLLPEHGHVDAEARQRIAALQKYSGLGAGFNLALRDLEIRGAGNLLGAAQSGHIAAIGFGLYCQLLKRTIARLKGEPPPLLIAVDLDIDFLELSPGSLTPESAACLPYAYVEDEAHRMTLHRRIAEITSIKELRLLQQEITDRYGKPPAPMLRLLHLSELRVRAAQREIGRIETRAGKVYLYKNNERAPLTFKHHLPRLTGTSADQHLASLLKIVTAYTPVKPGAKQLFSGTQTVASQN